MDKILELIMSGDEIEEFENKYLEDAQTQTYKLDDGKTAKPYDIVYAGINDKFFTSLEAYGEYLIDYFGVNTFKVPHIREGRI